MTRIRPQHAVQTMTTCVPLEPLLRQAPSNALPVLLDRLTLTLTLRHHALNVLRATCQWKVRSHAHRVISALPIQIQMQRPRAQHALPGSMLPREPHRALHVPVVRRTWMEIQPRLVWSATQARMLPAVVRSAHRALLALPTWMPHQLHHAPSALPGSTLANLHRRAQYVAVALQISTPIHLLHARHAPQARMLLAVVRSAHRALLALPTWMPHQLHHAPSAMLGSTLAHRP